MADCGEQARKLPLALRRHRCRRHAVACVWSIAKETRPLRCRIPALLLERGAAGEEEPRRGDSVGVSKGAQPQRKPGARRLALQHAGSPGGGGEVARHRGGSRVRKVGGVAAEGVPTPGVDMSGTCPGHSRMAGGVAAEECA